MENENTVELMTEEVVKVASEGAELASEGLSKGAKRGIVAVGTAVVIGLGVFVYKKIKKAKTDKVIVTIGDSSEAEVVEDEENE